jgi:CRISPR/Cas system Type II protein with McrA/HNH and RuvC-like nuclease domain
MIVMIGIDTRKEKDVAINRRLKTLTRRMIARRQTRTGKQTDK